MKTCKELGWKEGDKFKVVAGHAGCAFHAGQVVTLLYDDGTDFPRWKAEGGKTAFAHIDYMLPYEYVGSKYNLVPLCPPSKYTRSIYGVEIDIYDILNAWEVICPATQHAIKKLLMPGQRGNKSKLQDLREASQAIKRAIRLEERKCLQI